MNSEYDIEKLMKDIDNEAFEEAKKFGGKSKPVVSQEFSRIVLGKNPKALKPIEEFIEFSIKIAKD